MRVGQGEELVCWKLPNEGWRSGREWWDRMGRAGMCDPRLVMAFCWAQCKNASLDLLDRCAQNIIPPSMPRGCMHPQKAWCYLLTMWGTWQWQSREIRLRLGYIFSFSISFLIYFGEAVLGWKAREGFVTLCFLLSLESKCRLPFFKLWAEDQRDRVGYTGIKKKIPFEYQKHIWFISGLLWESLVCFSLLFLPPDRHRQAKAPLPKVPYKLRLC